MTVAGLGLKGERDLGLGLGSEGHDEWALRVSLELGGRNLGYLHPVREEEEEGRSGRLCECSVA